MRRSGRRGEAGRNAGAQRILRAMEAILDALSSAALFLGGGFVVYIWERRRRAPRIRVRALGVADASVRVEVENTSPEENSLNWRAVAHPWAPSRKVEPVVLRIPEGQDRSLPPFSPREFEYQVAGDDLVLPCELLRLRIDPTRGSAVSVWIVFEDSGSGEVVTFRRWAWEFLRRQLRSVRHPGDQTALELEYYCVTCGRQVAAPAGGGAQGQASDIEIAAREILRL